MRPIIPPHGGYEDLLSFRKARIVYDGTVRFCERYLDKRDRTCDQMVQAARSGKQNILEGSQASGNFERNRSQTDQRSACEPGRVARRLPGFPSRAGIATLG